MLTSRIVAWLCVVLTLLEALKYVARVSHNRKLNRFFHDIHIPSGILLLAFGLLHGVLAGNGNGEIIFAPLLFTANAGTLCFMLSVLLAVTYVARRKLGRKWMTLHRILTIAMLAVLVLHVYETGIGITDFFPRKEPAAVTVPEMVETRETEVPMEASEETAPLSLVEDGSPSEENNEGTSEEEIPLAEEFVLTEDEAPRDDTLEEAPDIEDAVEEESPPVHFSGAVLRDGTYTGSAQGYKGNIKVKVTVEGGAVTDITVESHTDTYQFFARAAQIISRFLSSQSLDADTVTGATYSAEGIRNAVYNALTGAVEEGALTKKEVTVGNGKRH